MCLWLFLHAKLSEVFIFTLIAQTLESQLFQKSLTHFITDCIHLPSASHDKCTRQTQAQNMQTIFSHSWGGLASDHKDWISMLSNAQICRAPRANAHRGSCTGKWGSQQSVLALLVSPQLLNLHLMKVDPIDKYVHCCTHQFDLPELCTQISAHWLPPLPNPRYKGIPSNEPMIHKPWCTYSSRMPCNIATIFVSITTRCPCSIAHPLPPCHAAVGEASYLTQKVCFHISSLMTDYCNYCSQAQDISGSFEFLSNGEFIYWFIYCYPRLSTCPIHWIAEETSKLLN